MTSSSCIFTREEFRKLSHERWKEHLKRCEYCRNYKPKKYYTLDPYAKPDFLTRDMVEPELNEKGYPKFLDEIMEFTGTTYDDIEEMKRQEREEFSRFVDEHNARNRKMKERS